MVIRPDVLRSKMLGGSELCLESECRNRSGRSSATRRCRADQEHVNRSGCTMHVGMSVHLPEPRGRRSRTNRSTRKISRWPAWRSRSGSSRSGAVEHHFTDYTMCPDVFQFLTYMARAPRTSSSGRWCACCPGTTRSGLPSRSQCSTSCPAAASSSAWGGGPAGSSSKGSGSTCPRRGSVSPSRPTWCSMPRERLRRVRRRVRTPAPQRHPSPPDQDLPRSDLRAAVSTESGQIMAEMASAS